MLEGERTAVEAVEIQRFHTAAQVHGQVCGLLFAHRCARHAAGRPTVQWVPQKLNEVRVRIFAAQLAKGNIATVIFSIRRMALSTAEGLIELFAFCAIANHGGFRTGRGRNRHQIMAQRLDRLVLGILVQSVEQIGHGGAGLEFLGIKQPMPQPTGGGGIVRGEERRAGVGLKPMRVLSVDGMTGHAVEFVDKHFASGNLLRRCVARETIKTRYHRLRRRN